MTGTEQPTTSTERPWAPTSTPPWAAKHRAPWWVGLGHRAAAVALLIITDPTRAYRAWRSPLDDYRQDADQ